MSATNAPIETTTANANSGCLSRLVRRIFFTMVEHPKYGWIRVGKAYASKKSAQEWVPFVRSYWRGLRTKVVSCTLRFVDGKLTSASAKTLDTKFNMAPPDNLEITSGERTAIELANIPLCVKTPNAEAVRPAGRSGRGGVMSGAGNT